MLYNSSQNQQNKQNHFSSLGSTPTSYFPTATWLWSRPSKKKVLKVLQVL
jgi:hypothetical protein